MSRLARLRRPPWWPERTRAFPSASAVRSRVRRGTSTHQGPVMGNPVTLRPGAWGDHDRPSSGVPIYATPNALGHAEPSPPASAEGRETARWLERVRPAGLRGVDVAGAGRPPQSLGSGPLPGAIERWLRSGPGTAVPGGSCTRCQPRRGRRDRRVPPFSARSPARVHRRWGRSVFGLRFFVVGLDPLPPAAAKDGGKVAGATRGPTVSAGKPPSWAPPDGGSATRERGHEG